MTATAYVMIGAPASGKSTRARTLAESSGGVVISTDSIREELYGSEEVQGDWGAIKRTLTDRVKQNAGKPIILDATHYRSSYRREAISLLRSVGYDVIVGVIVDTPCEECLERNATRDRKVPEHVIENMWSVLKSQMSGIDKEGFTVTLKV